MTAVAALFIISDKNIVITIKITNTHTKFKSREYLAKFSAIRLANPKSFMVFPIGIIAANNTTTGQSICR